MRLKKLRKTERLKDYMSESDNGLNFNIFDGTGNLGLGKEREHSGKPKAGVRPK